MTKTIEEKYQKLTQREHVLLRGPMYIGSTKKETEELWVAKDTEDGSFQMVKEMIHYTPGFLKIFDEVLTNATDHSFRDPTVNIIKIDYSQETGEISIWNNGSGIPVKMHKEHDMYVPELIFGHLLSGSNYDDSTTRTGAGTNGLGSKLTCIYSKKFVIETIDSDEKKKFVQEYSDNMTQRTKPKITSNSGKSYTKITFIPDYTRFEMKGLEDDTVLLLRKRVLDCIACTNANVQVYLNGEKLKGKGLVDYTKYFFDSDKVISESHVEKIKNRNEVTEYIWEYAIVPAKEYDQVSFVNGNATNQGGKHVDYILYQIVNKYKKMLEEKKKLKELKPNFIKDKLFLFLRATIANPTFNSQTKETLTTPSKDFGCYVTVSDAFITKLYKSSITDEIVEFCKLKESAELSKQDGKKKTKIFIPKLEDAQWAGTVRSDQCTLILTEGDSAKTFAMWGRSVVGTEKFGAFPLKGKCLNIRDATVQQLVGNEEINNIKQILGLKQGKEYKDTSDLRYGKMMLLTDADVDGSHIKSLVVNMFHYWWPSLLKLDFIQTLRTPIIKAVRGKTVVEFFTEQDYIKWKNQTNVNTSNYQIRYFKGLGTSQKDDAKDTFKRIDELKVDYYHKDTNCDEAILLAFEKDKNTGKSKSSDEISCADKRKVWLSNYNKNDYIDIKENKVPFQDLIHKELIHFSIYDNLRSIPSLCDGFKPSQRKIIHYMMDKNITKSIKVAQLSGYVSAETSYHHGEVSLQQAIIGMAQDFCGTNNLNLLYPDGNHGSRYAGGKDAASPRYIFTRLSNYTPVLFNKSDNPLLNYQIDDGQQIEPEWFLPIIPTVLVNGCEGIGTGYSTFIPPHNPKEIVNNILRVLDNKEPLPMKPWYRNFNGTIEETDPGSYISKGIWKQTSPSTIEITELPIGSWVTSYKEFLEGLVEGNNGSNSKKKSSNNGLTLKDVKNQTTDENSDIKFIVQFQSSKELEKLKNSDTLLKELKLTKSIHTHNMYLFDNNLLLTKYTNTNDILLDFYDIRLDLYSKRKIHLIKVFESELLILNSKVRFIKEYIDGSLDINRKTKDFITSLLEEQKFPKHPEHKNYDYLVMMPIVSLSKEKIDDLTKTRNSKQNQLDILKNKTEKDLWREDLIELQKLI